MGDSGSSKPLVVTSSLSFKVTTPSFYNQPKKFASVAPPRPKSQIGQPHGSAVGTAVIGRVGELPPPPPAVCEDFPPPPPPLDDAELPAPPPECQTTPPAFEAPPPAFPAPPPPPEEDLPLPSPPGEAPPLPCSPPAPLPPPPPPPPLPAASNSNNAQRFLEKQTSFDRQLDSLTDMLSEMETRGPFNPKMPSQVPLVPTPKPFVPPPTAPKPGLSFLPPPELQDRPPPAPWAEELKLRQTNRHANQPPGSAPAPAPAQAQPAPKGPGVAPKSSFPVSNAGASSGPKAAASGPPASQKQPSGGAPAFAPKLAPSASFPPPPPPVNQAPPTSVTPGFSRPKPAPAGNQARVSPPSVSPQPKAVAPPPSSQTKPMGAPASKPSAPGPGGVPLSMKEVEELERMTQDFIKDMDTHAPVITSPPTERCGKCGEALSRAQPAVRAMDKLFHSDCFCCMDCQRTLQGLQFYDRDGQPQCEDCYVSSLAVCARCNERVTDRVLKAVGQTFHAHCFRCCTCSCSLEGAPFITDDNNNPYCVADYHRRFSPLCVSCNEPIVPDPGSEETVRVVALEKNFHLKCYRCEDCARPLSIEADADGCYPLDGRILCMKCHTQRAKQAAQ